MTGGVTGAGEGDRTLVVSLGSFCSTIELHPRHPHFTRDWARLTNFETGCWDDERDDRVKRAVMAWARRSLQAFAAAGGSCGRSVERRGQSDFAHALVRRRASSSRSAANRETFSSPVAALLGRPAAVQLAPACDTQGGLTLILTTPRPVRLHHQIHAPFMPAPAR